MITNHRVIHAAGTKLHRASYIYINTASAINDSWILSPFSSAAWFTLAYSIQLAFKLYKSTVNELNTFPRLLDDVRCRNKQCIDIYLPVITHLVHCTVCVACIFFLAHAFVQDCLVQTYTEKCGVCKLQIIFFRFIEMESELCSSTDRKKKSGQ